MKRTPLKRGKPLARKEWKPKRTSLARGQAFKARRTRVRAKSAKRPAYQTELAEIRAACMVRAAGKCEHCGIPLGTGEATPELDHVFGRRSRVQSVEGSMVLSRACHRRKTNNDPSRAAWLKIAWSFARRIGYAAQADALDREIQWVEAKSAAKEAMAGNR